MQTYKFNSGKYKKMDLFIKKTVCGENGQVRLSTDLGEVKSIFLKYPDYEYKHFDLEEDTDYIITFNKTDCELAYLCGNDDLLEEGICFIEFRRDGMDMYFRENMSEAYGQRYRNQIHFSPFKNWMNDPNGLCYYKGKYHMFYQYNPKSQVWDSMHWGHAVSKDLIHWIHQPIVLFPQKELYHNTKFTGGAFSGSAIVDDNDDMRLFLTRSFNSKEDLWTREWQTTCTSSDGIEFSPEREILDETPEGVGMDFRDPMICRINNKWYMFIAGVHYDIPAVLCYSSQDLESWEYDGPILKEDRFNYAIAECPDVYEIGDKLVIVVG
ncbi:MAG TPA: hypothetical protein VFD57_07635, partial [Clostridia bacterium]|nr:hypothetical protein [Clostridia bacterium]